MSTHNRPKIALALMAHPDDAEILCGGTLIRLRERGWAVHLATCTAGDCGSATLSAEEIASIRRSEARGAAESIGGHYHCLEWRDLKVVFDGASVDAVIDLLRRVNPSLVFTHPRYDYMIDHEQCHLIARAATFGLAIPNASSVAVPQGAGVPHLYYADPLEGRDPYSGETVTPTTLVDVTEVMDRKAEMLACHASQRDWLRSHHGMDEYLDAMKRHAQSRGRAAGTEYAEAFVQHRGHAYPHHDALDEALAEAVG